MKYTNLNRYVRLQISQTKHSCRVHDGECWRTWCGSVRRVIWPRPQWILTGHCSLNFKSFFRGQWSYYMWPLSPGITSHPFGILLLFLSHQALKCLMQYNCEGIRLEILFGVIVAPWTRCMTTIAWATVLGPPSSISMNNYSSPTPYVWDSFCMYHNIVSTWEIPWSSSNNGTTWRVYFHVVP
jgi:hypothetical protein